MQPFARLVALAAAALPFFVLAAPVPEAAAGDVIPGKWIIQLKPEANIAAVASQVQDIHARNIARREISDAEIGGIENEYDLGSFKGYSGSFDTATVEELKNLPEVLNVEQDFIMTTLDVITQSAPADWGLASISSRTANASDYLYDSSAGEGTFVYVVDTGIRTTHEEFEGRAVWGFNAVNNQNTDNEGHGTHVAGTSVSKTYGVAKKATVVAVKIFEGSTGSASTVINGFNWAVNDIVAKNRTNTAVINMSLGGSASATWDAAITASWEKGVLSVVAAGNENRNANLVSPARSPEALTVGNLQRDDFRRQGRSGSNYGPAVDIFAAGTDIISTYARSDTATISLTGTSMASPHVAGLVSYLRGLEKDGMSAADVKAKVLALATPGRVQDTLGSANLVAYNGISQ